jgi:hypothetical protein
VHLQLFNAIAICNCLPTVQQPDGRRPQHRKDLLQCPETASDFLSAVTSSDYINLAGCCPEAIATKYYHGRLLALDKKSGGIRPILLQA